ncbi:ras GTPase-activating protein 3-like [Halichondria panicea]|uniref:ras GTPase-activating protein 3-like n=1 Tax=Halichondria panicea TaxID=6063 RepID=UPI00312B7398
MSEIKANESPVESGRVEEVISMRVLEAKNLSTSNDLRSSRDTYVCVGLDQEEIFRTAVVEKSLTPFYGEEYKFTVPRSFRHLSFYVWESCSLSRDTMLGKVAISCEELKNDPVREDRWYPIKPIGPDSEVQGCVQVSLNVSEKLMLNRSGVGHTQFVLSVRVLEGCGLSVWGTSGLSDPYCQVLLLGNGPGIQSELKRGQVHKRTVNPKFQDNFDFPINSVKDLRNIIVRASIWHQSLLSEDVFMGQVNLLIGSLEPGKAHTSWYTLLPRPNVSGRIPQPSIGTMRIKVNYALDYVHPRSSYEPLISLLARSFENGEFSNSAMWLLNECSKDRPSMGRSLVKTFLSLNKLEEMMRYLIELEVNGTLDPNTLFRGNSLVSKVIDEFMKVNGHDYLKKTLTPCIDEIYEARKNCEIDQARLNDGDNVDVNMANLMFFVVKIISAITASARSCPRIMCSVFAMLREAAIRKFPDSQETVQYSAVSGFVFLRFFAPAILSPKLFHLRQEYPSPVVARTLTLISKSVQSLVNIGGPKSASLKHKELHMSKLNMELQDQTQNVMAYLTAISDPQGGSECSQEDTVFTEGYLVKRSQGRKKGPKNFRRRFFSLTNAGLSYHKGKGEAPLCSIPPDELLAVERVDDDVFSMKFMMQVVQPTRILYMQASNSVEQLEWLRALAKVCSSSPMDFYHSGAFIGGDWTCCGSPSEDTTGGCKPLSLAVRMLGCREDIDLQKELHNIYKMFLAGQDYLMKMKDEATVAAREDGEGAGADLPPRLRTLCELMVFIKNLEITSTSLLQSTAPRLGTREAPYCCSSSEAVIIRVN